MKKSNTSLWKRGTAVVLMFVLAFLLSTSPIYESRVQAASVKSGGEYISEVKLFVKKDGSFADAESWCKQQGEGWKVLSGDQQGNLNSGAAGAFTSDVGVFFCYRTTTNPEEAITDLAVMNEKGNYSEGDYEALLKKQKETYIDMVKNMKGMIEEYRKNYEAKVPMAVKSHDYLNAYKDDDSGELLGDILLKADDDKLAEILLQCNGMVVLAMQEKLASACDTAKTTWLDRMSKLGSYDKLKSAFSKNMSSNNIEKELDARYKETATLILDHWDDLHKHFEDASAFEEKNGLKDATKEQLDAWAAELEPTDPGMLSFQELMTLTALGGYKYGDKSLLYFFSKTKEQVLKDGIETLYPMAACLKNGQICALHESLDIFRLIQEAEAATIVNKNDSAIMTEIKKEAKDGEISDVKEEIDKVDQMVADLGEKKISIYEGVDRDVYKGGVAVTTDAKNSSASSESSWTEIFNKNGTPTMVSIGAGIGALATGIMACVFAGLAIKEINESIEAAVVFTSIADKEGSFAGLTIEKLRIIYGEDNVNTLVAGKIHTLDDLVKKANAENGEEFQKVLEKLTENAKGETAFKVYNGLKIGFTVFTILLAAADIAINVYALYKYYNVEHLPIPHHIVDIIHAEGQEDSYVAYKSVRDQDGNCGDLNGGNARQWLALYYTKDTHAGNPILAPSDGSRMVIRVGSSEAPESASSPLHMFGKSNAAQNLTFADGENGYSYNDKNGGTYLWFSHTGKVITYTDDAETDKTPEAVSVTKDAEVVSDKAAGTALSGGVVALIAVASAFAGGFIGFVIANTRRRRKAKK